MRFWDSSAIVPLVCQESASRETIKLYKQDTRIVVWTLTPTEVLSALCRKLREGSLSRQEFKLSRDELQLLSDDWMEVHAVELVRDRAHRLLELHPIRAADALQLASALVATEDRPRGFEFVSYDAVLASAAEKEGFTIRP
ncbi:MAG: type II toxin-antitoxin system VapC family toxin [Acidobacteriota bacterium]